MLVRRAVNTEDDHDLQVDDERMSDHQQNVLLVVNVFDLFEANHFSDGQGLEGEVLPRVTVTH